MLASGKMLSIGLIEGRAEGVDAAEQGRPLRPGDQLPIGQPRQRSVTSASVPSSWRPAFPEAAASWAVGVLPGPNAAPDYFTEEDIATLHSATYTVHYNSYGS